MKISECVAGMVVEKKRKCWEGGGTVSGTIVKRVCELGTMLVVVLLETGDEVTIHPKNLYKA
jgi:hypothetical protein